MACDISMTEPAVVAPSYLPRNVLDHMNPFFFKSHHHSHSHAHSHSHSHSCSHANGSRYSHSQHHPVRQQPYSPPHPHCQPASETNPVHTQSSTASPLSPPADTPPSSSVSTSDLQTPVPQRTTLHALDPLSVASYNTPPATPPLVSVAQLQQQTPAASSASHSASGTAGTETDPVAWCTARARIPTPDGSEYFLHIYENTRDKKEHLAFVFGDAIRSQSLDKVQPNETEMDRVKRGAYVGRLRGTVASESEEQRLTLEYSTGAAAATSATTPASVPLARIHSECFTGEIGHSARCDCGEQLDEAIRLMKAEGSGVVVYLRQEGRGIGLGEKLKAYNLQDLGYDTVMANLLLNHGADERTYEVAQAILQDLGLSQIRLLTNNPDKIEQVEKGSQIRVVERVAMMPKSWEAIEQGLDMEVDFEVKEGAVENKIVRGKELDRYLKVKVERMRHLIPIPTSI
ncbi:GTP cyclohydrolase II [Mortierella alpina]|nr:GTP cyclohydrolase II [Mortierella alpina]